MGRSRKAKNYAFCALFGVAVAAVVFDTYSRHKVNMLQIQKLEGEMGLRKEKEMDPDIKNLYDLSRVDHEWMGHMQDNVNLLLVKTETDPAPHYRSVPSKMKGSSLPGCCERSK